MGLWDCGKLCAKTLRVSHNPQPAADSMIEMDKRKNQNTLFLLDIHIAVNRAARHQATFAGSRLMRKTLPPLRFSDLRRSSWATLFYWQAASIGCSALPD